MRLNLEYAAPALEPLWMGLFKLRHAFEHKPENSTQAILIVNVCLIGEFAASVPAIHAFIEKHSGVPIDIVVSPALKELAEHLRGIRGVYSALPIAPRILDQQHASTEGRIFGPYDEMIVLRMSRSVFRLLKRVQARQIRTGAKEMLRYGFHLLVSIMRKQTPRPWRDACFTMLSLTPAKPPFEKLFSFSEKETKKIRLLPELQAAKKKVIIHTGASWILNHWPARRWANLLQLLAAEGDWSFIFVGNAGIDLDDFGAIASQLTIPPYSLVGKISILELLLVLRESDFFIGIDSGPSNLAHLAELPSITLLGPAPHMFTPPNPQDIVIDKSKGRGLYQRFIYGKQQAFIEQITPEEVCRAFERLQSSSASRPLA